GSTQQYMKSGVAKHLGVAGIHQQNGLVDEINVPLFAKVRYFLIQSGLSNVFWAEDTTRGFFGWLVSIKQRKLELVNVKCIFLGYHKSIVGNKLWRLDDVTSKVLHGFEFEVKPLNDHTFEVEPPENVDQEAATVAENAVTTTMAITESVHQGLLDKSKGNVLGMKIVRDQSGNTLKVSQFRFYNGKLVQTLLEGHFMLSLEGSLSRDCDVKKNGKWSCIYAVGSQEYQMIYTRLDIASADVGVLDKFDRGLQTDVQVSVDFDYAMGRSITVMESRYELRLVARIATGALVKDGSRSEVPT
nr:zinc finger, CCHC-type [Tanacetum cinerariifolium]